MVRVRIRRSEALLHQRVELLGVAARDELWALLVVRGEECGVVRVEDEDPQALNRRRAAPIWRLRCVGMATATATGSRVRRSGARLLALAGGAAIMASRRLEQGGFS